MRIFQFFILLFLVSACNKKQESIPPGIPPPATEWINYYSEINVVIDRENKVYYYFYLPKGWLCGTGLDLTQPVHINIYPDSLKEITLPDLKKVLKTHHFKGNPEKSNFLNIAIDKGKDDIYQSLISELDDPSLKIIKRDLTEEETVVLAYKRTGVSYDGWKIDWKNPNIDCKKKAEKRQTYLDLSNMYDSIKYAKDWVKAEKRNGKLEPLTGQRNEALFIGFYDWVPEINLGYKYTAEKRIQDDYSVISVRQTKNELVIETKTKSNDTVSWKMIVESNSKSAEWYRKAPSDKKYIDLGIFIPRTE